MSVIVCTGCARPIPYERMQPGQHLIQCARCGKKMNIVTVQPVSELGLVKGG